MQRPQGSAGGGTWVAKVAGGEDQWPAEAIAGTAFDEESGQPCQGIQRSLGEAAAEGDPVVGKGRPRPVERSFAAVTQIRHYTRSRRHLAPALAGDPRSGLIDLSCWRNDVPPQIGYCSVLATVRSQIQVLFRSQ